MLPPGTLGRILGLFQLWWLQVFLACGYITQNLYPSWQSSSPSSFSSLSSSISYIRTLVIGFRTHPIIQMISFWKSWIELHLQRPFSKSRLFTGFETYINLLWGHHSTYHTPYISWPLTAWISFACICTLYKWSHIRCTSLFLASFAQYHTCEIYVHVNF